MLKNCMIFIALVIGFSCKNKFPVIEDCLFLPDASFCIDARRKPKEYKVKDDYFFGMSCTNSADRKTIENAIDVLIVDNAELKRQLKLKCKK